jgi:hypothetical protein
MFVALSHFQAALLFAFFTAIVMGVIGRETDPERLRYGAYVFGCFVAAIIGISWLMYIGHG